jgi:localization factor PodJL
VALPTPPKNDVTKFVVAPQATVSADTVRDVSGSPVLRKEGVPLRAATLQHEGRNEHDRLIPRGELSKQIQLSRLDRLANSGNANALTILGLRGADGDAAISPSDAVRFLTQAAKKGQAVAQYRLGTLYERGEGVPTDGVQAAHWYELAANQGNRKAMHNLAVLYAAGAQGNKNMALAAGWFAKAALLGLSDAQFNLAVLYERGDGVRQSLLDAYKWYSVAAASGDAESKSRINILQTQLNDTDKETGNRLAAAFRPAPLNRRANVPPDMADLKD